MAPGSSEVIETHTIKNTFKYEIYCSWLQESKWSKFAETNELHFNLLLQILITQIETSLIRFSKLGPK